LQFNSANAWGCQSEKILTGKSIFPFLRLWVQAVFAFFCLLMGYRFYRCFL